VLSYIVPWRTTTSDARVSTTAINYSISQATATQQGSVTLVHIGPSAKIRNFNPSPTSQFYNDWFQYGMGIAYEYTGWSAVNYLVSTAFYCIRARRVSPQV